jgi:hypothetical protein
MRVRATLVIALLASCSTPARSSTSLSSPMPSPETRLTAQLTAPSADPNERPIRVFFCFHESECLGDDPSDVSVPVSRLGLLVDNLVWDRDFFGLIDDAGRILQVRYDAEHESWIEIVVEAQHGSYGRWMTRTELRTFVAALPSAFTPEVLPDSTFTAW